MKAGQTSIDHMEEFLYTYDFQTDDDIKSVVAVAKETGVAVTPTLVTYDYIGRQVGNIQELLERPELKYMEPSVLRSWGPENNSYRKRIKAEQAPRMQQLLAFQKKLVKQMHDAGVPILVGTDAGGYGGSVPYVLPGFSMREELLALVDAGLTPYEALRGATSDAAKVLRGEKEFGTVTTGKRADLILLTENPLKNVAQLDKQLGVMVRGRWLPARELQDMLDELPRLYATEANFIQQVRQVGAAQALAQYRTAQRAAPRTRFFREGALNSLGYDLLNEKKIKDALEIFKLNVALYPDSADVYDSLAEAYMLDGQRELAIKSYRRSLALNPQNSNAVKMLRQLQRQ
jgi:hypothetical protein